MFRVPVHVENHADNCIAGIQFEPSLRLASPRYRHGTLLCLPFTYERSMGKLCRYPCIDPRLTVSLAGLDGGSRLYFAP